MSDLTKSESLEFREASAKTVLYFSIPFTIDTNQNDFDVCCEIGDLTQIQVKVEVRYTTSTGNYTYIHSCTVASGLPLSVGVTDAFRSNM